MPNSERAKQFMPFNSLTGYFELLAEAEQIVVEKRELTEDEGAKLNRKLPLIRKGDIVRITYYESHGYRLREGIVSKISFDSRRITVVKTEIPFDDILDIE